MALAKILFFLFLCHLLLLKVDSQCPKSFECGYLGSLEFPFSEVPGCGLFLVKDCDSVYPTIHTEWSWYQIKQNIATNKLKVTDPTLDSHLKTRDCFSLGNLSMPQSPFVSFTISPSLTLFTCPSQTRDEQHIQAFFHNYRKEPCQTIPSTLPHNPIPTVYYTNTTHVPTTGKIPTACSVIQLPKKPNQNQGNLFDLLTADFTLEWNFSEPCAKCHRKGGQCLISGSSSEVHCKKGISMLSAVYFLGTPDDLCVLLEIPGRVPVFMS